MSPRRRRQQGGNAFVESALVLVPFFALMLGIVDFGMAIFLRSTLQNAVAAGVRYAITYQTNGSYCMDDSIRLATQSAAMGFLGATTTPNNQITVKYYNPTNLATEVLGAAGNQPFNVVEVTVTGFQWNWLSNMSGVMGAPRGLNPLNIVTYSSDRLGGIPPGTSPPCR